MKKGKKAGITIAIIAGICLAGTGVSALIRSNAEKQETVLIADTEVQTGDKNAKKDDAEYGTAAVNASIHAAYVVPVPEEDKKDGKEDTGFMAADNAGVASPEKKEETVPENKPSDTGNAKPSQQVPSGEKPKQETPAEEKPSAKPPEPVTTEQTTTEKQPEAVWVVDVEAYTEEVPVYEYVQIAVCSNCGADISGHAWEHIDANLDNGCGGYHSEMKQVYVGTETVYHEEEGHWEYR